MTEKLSKAQLLQALNQFTGTESYHRTGFTTLATEGVLYLAKEAECFWLLSIIDSVAPFTDFAVCKLKVTEDEKGRYGEVIIDSGHNPNDPDEQEAYKLFHNQTIEWTDFPLEEITLYIQESENGPVIMLPSEY